MDEYTRDNLCGGISVIQKKKGYRFSVDPLILAGTIDTPNGPYVADFGTGSGIIPLILLRRFENIRVTAYEVQKDLYDIAKENIRDNGFTERAEVLNENISKVRGADKFDLIVSNPPYVKKGAGRVNPNGEAAVARHEIMITLEDLVKKASELLKSEGRFAVIFPVLRLKELLDAMALNNINPEILTYIFSKPDRDAELFIIEGVKEGTGELITQNPFYIYKEDGKYTERMEMILSGRFED